MLHSRRNIGVVIRALKTYQRPLVVDPIMVATSGRRLLERSAMSLLQNELLPRASLVTPNLHEAEILSSLKIRSLDEMKEAARRIHDRFGCAALVKGGHLDNSKEAIDVFFDGNHAVVLKARRVRGIRTHGTGCTYSAAITAHLAHGKELLEAIRLAKKYVTRSLIGGRRVGGHFVSGLF